MRQVVLFQHIRIVGAFKKIIKRDIEIIGEFFDLHSRHGMHTTLIFAVIALVCIQQIGNLDLLDIPILTDGSDSFVIFRNFPTSALLLCNKFNIGKMFTIDFR